MSYQIQLTMLAKQLIFDVSSALAFSFSFQAFFKSSTSKPYKTYVGFNYDQEALKKKKANCKKKPIWTDFRIINYSL